jgi:thiosulfate/3-mercaptopyruvate sulfurtransferase
VCRYTGADPEPRGLPSGHMPHSFSLPFNAFLQKNSGHHSGATFTTFLPPKELRRNLEDAVGTEYARLILDGQRRVTTTCGSGMTAAILWLGLKLINETTPVALYDEVRRAPVMAWTIC